MITPRCPRGTGAASVAAPAAAGAGPPARGTAELGPLPGDGFQPGAAGWAQVGETLGQRGPDSAGCRAPWALGGHGALYPYSSYG